LREEPEKGHGWISSVKPNECQEKIITFFGHFLLGDELIEYTLWFIWKTSIVSKLIAMTLCPLLERDRPQGGA
jgi:hypothetical protein